MKIRIWPDFSPKERGEGGIRRVNESLHRWLPYYGVEIVDSIEYADIVNVHADSIDTKGKPLAYSGHGLYWAGHEWPEWALSANAKLIKATKHADSFSVPSKFVHNVFARGMLLDPFVLMHGVEFDEWEPAKNMGYVVWLKNRPDPVCDPTPVNQLAERFSGISFVTTFGNDNLPNIKATGRITHERSKEIIKHAAIYLATVQETGAISLMEAMACGVPAVGYRWGVNPEIIENDVTGILVEPNDINALQEALVYCIQHRKRLGENAREYIRENHQWKDRIKDYLPFYESALNGEKRDHPKISMVVTAYNLASYLPACLDSILAQDFAEWECIIVDDASPDSCGEIADSYAHKDKRFRVLHNSSNAYLAEARNIGIRCANGDYILALDADDELGKGALGILSEALDANRDLDIVTGAFELIEPDGRHWVSTWPSDKPSYNQQILHRNQVPYASMYRRWVWERTGGYRRRWKSAEDAEFWTRGMSYGATPAKVTNVPTLVYNNRPNSMSHTTKEPDWTSWFSWSRFEQLTPFGASDETNDKARPVLDYDPIMVSVVIPVGPSHDFFLQDALDSLVAQTYQNWEVICVNDTGKTWFDKTGKRINPYISGYPFARWIDSNKNEGVSKARNKGIQAAKGKYILFLDADDYLQPLALEAMMYVISSHGGWVYGDWYDEYGELKEAKDFSEEEVLRKMPCSITCLFNKQDLDSVGGFDEQAIGWEDWDLMLSLLNNGVCGTRIKMPIFTYRYFSGRRRESNYVKEKEILAWIKKKHAKLYEECA